MTNFVAAFKVINARNCPYYGVDDWFVLTDKSLQVPPGTTACLILVREFTNLLFALMPGVETGFAEQRNTVYTCGGCNGLIKFQLGDLPEGAQEAVASMEQEANDLEQEMKRVKPRRSGVVLSGSLEEISPSELLQFCHMHQKTGKLLLDVTDGTVRVAFREGAIIGARYGELEGKDAIYAILGERSGKFSYITGIPETLMEVEDLGDFMMILLEGLKHLDESD